MIAVAVLPCLNEQDTIAEVVAAIPRDRVSRIIVVDNGSTDMTAERARAAGAVVVTEAARGYGAACLAGIREARRAGADAIVLLDADGSDPPEHAGDLLDELERGADLALGVRDPRRTEPGALTFQQRFGNALALALMRTLSGAAYSDLPPFKAMRAAALDRLGPCDPSYGFTIDLMLRAHERRLSIVEVPVPCRRRRGGTSKVSGTLRGTVGAGMRIVGTVWKHSSLRGLRS